MYIPPKALSEKKLSADQLRLDKKNCAEFEDFGLGEEALYVEKFAIARMAYIPLTAIERVYKRLAISKSYFEGKMFGTLSYLVVRYDGKEKAFRFTHEENVDAILNAFREKTSIPVGKV